MEHFYRMMRERLGVLIDGDGRPEGGEWNYDEDNRERFRGPSARDPAPVRGSIRTR